MSKVVKSVGRAVSKVVKGAVNVVKKVAKSKLGKALMVAAAVYFGGAAIQGALSTAGTTTSALTGAANGISSAWSGLTSAASSVASSLTGSGSASAAATTTTEAVAGMTQSQMLAAQTAGMEAATSSGLLSSAGNVASAAWNSLGGYGKAAAIQAGTQLYAANQVGKAAEEQANAQAAQYNANVGGQIYGDAPRPRPVGMLQQAQPVQQVQPTPATGIQSGQFGNSTMYTLAPYQSNSGGLLAQLQQQRQALMNARYA